MMIVLLLGGRVHTFVSSSVNNHFGRCKKQDTVSESYDGPTEKIRRYLYMNSTRQLLIF